MRKMMLSTALVLVAVLVLSVIASAQPGGPGGGRGGQRGGFGGPGGPGGFGFSYGSFLRNEDLKAQLGLTEDQVQQITKIYEDSRANRPQGGGQGGPPTPEQMAEMQKRRQEMQEKVKQVLTPSQQEKAKVIIFQVSGGLSNPGISADALEVLNLTADQKAKLKAIEDERSEAMRANFAQMQDMRSKPEEERRQLFEAMRAKGEELRKSTEAKVEAILTADQKAKAAQLTEEGKDIREKFQQQMQQQRNRGGNGPQGGDGAYQPGSNSWQPGQGAGNQPQGGQQRRAFPRRDNPQPQQ